MEVVMASEFKVGDRIRYTPTDFPYEVVGINATDPIGGGKGLLAAVPLEGKKGRVHYLRPSDVHHEGRS
jgi:hypothetical protein